MNLEEETYNKIIQLVKSDCTNNRLLGFQLAKGLGYDLDIMLKLLESIPLDGENLIIIVGKLILKYNYRYNDKLGWSFRIYEDDDKSENIKYEIRLKDGIYCNNNIWYETYNDVIRKFINFIINE